MAKTASLTVRVSSATKDRIGALARVIHRSQSFVVEEALEHYLEMNEWQTQGIIDALVEADSASAEWIDHEDILAERERKGAN